MNQQSSTTGDQAKNRVLSNLWEPYPELIDKLDDVSKRIESALEGFALADGLALLLAQKGKMLRPALLLIGSGYGNPPVNINDAAAAVEMLHIATLLHDDVLDEAVVRRNVPTLHITAGVKNAVLAGDWLFTRAVLLIASFLKQNQIKLLSDITGRICNSEIEQDLRKGKVFLSTRTYLRTIAGKTAALIALSLRSGAELADADPSIKNTLQRLGYNIGMAFQIQDDILDFIGESSAFQKSTGKDIREGICTLPLIMALQNACKTDPAVHDFITNLPALGIGSEAYFCLLVKQYNGIDEASRIAERYIQRAKHEVQKLPASKETIILMNIINRLAVRTY